MWTRFLQKGNNDVWLTYAMFVVRQRSCSLNSIDELLLMKSISLTTLDILKNIYKRKQTIPQVNHDAVDPQV